MSDVARDRIYQSSFGSLRGFIEREVAKHKEKLGSPIEELFLEALIAWHASRLLLIPRINGVPGKSRTTVDLQAVIDQYRVDFLVQLESSDLVRTTVRCVVECDGHDFHDRTKEQAARDKKRDRDLQAAGYIVLRFTGSQIHRDAFGCVDELMGCITQSVLRQWPGGELPSSEADA